MAVTACYRRSPAWTRRPSGAAARNWTPRSRIIHRRVSVAQAADDHRLKKDPGIVAALQAVVEPETAGDPMSDQKWGCSSLRTVSARLDDAGHRASPPTVARLLDQLGYALHVNAKRLAASADRPDRQAQFEHIAAQQAAFAAAGLPIISVDSKKKELIGNFRNSGTTWRREAVAVNVHDLRQDALGRAVPYGIYEPLRNRGTV